MEFDYNEAMPQDIYSDKSKLYRIFLNLISNAIKSTKEGVVRVKVWADGNLAEHYTLHAHIQDTGIGMPKNSIHQLCDSFRSVRGAFTPGDQGLGLFLVQRYIRLLDGHMDISSEEQVGTRIHLQLSIDGFAELAPTSAKANHACVLATRTPVSENRVCLDPTQAIRTRARILLVERQYHCNEATAKTMP